MPLTDKPNIYIATLFVIAGILVGGGMPIGGWWSIPIGCLLAGIGVVEIYTWAKFQAATNLLWENTAKAARSSSMLQTIQKFCDMPLSRLEGMVNVMYILHGDEQDRADGLHAFRAAVDEMKRETEQAAGYDSGGRWYAVDAVDFARKNQGWLPPLRKTGEGTKERTTLEKFYRELERSGAIQPAAGRNPARVTDWELAEQIARQIGAQ